MVKAGVSLYINMPKYIAAKLIYEGMYEYLIRIQLSKKGRDPYYTSTSYNKKNYSLEDVMKIRNKLLKEYEADGLRRTTGKYCSANIDNDNFVRIAK